MSYYSHIFKWGVNYNYVICYQNKKIRGIFHLLKSNLILSLLIPLYKYNNVGKRSFNVCTTLREWTKCWYRAAAKWFYWTNCCRSWREKDTRYVMKTILFYLHFFYSTFFTYFLWPSPFLSSFLPSFYSIHPSFQSLSLSPNRSFLISPSFCFLFNFRFWSFLRWWKW